MTTAFNQRPYTSPAASAPLPLWTETWRGAALLVFAVGNNSPLSLAQAAAVLNDDELARAARFHSPADRARWVRCRALLRMQLSILLSAEASELRFRLGPQGKPSVADREDLHFNLSHAGDFAAIATGPQPLGVDIEVIRPEVDARSLAQHYFRTEEAAALSAARTPLQDFFRLWTAKEAVMKCTGLGLSLPPDAVAVSGAAARRTDTGARFALFTHADGDAAFVLTAAVEV